jgi:hypothetical protein
VSPALPPEAPTTATSFRVGDIDFANAAEMRELFASVFGKPMSEAFWSWKYQDGHSHGLGVWDGDTLVAHYGGVAADIIFEGKPARAVQIVDVMVVPAARYGVRTQSPFFLATSTFIDRYIGYGQPYLLGYGFPSDRHMKLAQRLELYARVGGMSELTMHGGARMPADWLLQRRTLTDDNFPQYAAAIDSLWQRMQTSLPAAAILVRKDAERIHYRYFQHPEQRYRLLWWQNRFTGKPFAVAVVKEEPTRALLMDIVADAADFPRVLRLVANNMAREHNLPLVFWLSSAWVERLQLGGLAAVKALPISTPARFRTEGPQSEVLQDRWCLTAGDTDYL